SRFSPTITILISGREWRPGPFPDLRPRRSSASRGTNASRFPSVSKAGTSTDEASGYVAGGLMPCYMVQSAVHFEWRFGRPKRLKGSAVLPIGERQGPPPTDSQALIGSRALAPSLRGKTNEGEL